MGIRKILLVALLVGLTGCGGGSARQLLGLDRRAPDAFAVTTHAPLEMPADMASLPPPQPGAPRPQEITPEQQARGALFLDGRVSEITGTKAAAPSAAEANLLGKTGPADPDVRAQVNREAAKDADTQSGPLDWLIFWRDKPQPGVAVDAAAEAERLKKAAQADQSPTATPTPVIEDSGRLNVPKAIQ